MLRQMFPKLKVARAEEDDEEDVESPTSEEDEFISKVEAAKMLHINERTVFRYVVQGKLRLCVRGRHHGVRRSDIRQLLRDREDPLPLAMNRRTLALARAELRIARMELDQCKDVLNMRWTPLGLTGEQLVERYQQAMFHVKDGCADAPLREWVEFLLRLRHHDLETIEALTKDAHPWRPFFHIAAGLDPRLNQQAKEPALAKYLAAAREHVDMMVYAWIVARYGEDVMRRVADDLGRQSRE
jgi:hypothetical protein